MKPTLRLLALSCAMLLQIGCVPPSLQTTDANKGETLEANPPVRVAKTKPMRKALVRTIDIPGRVEAFEVTPLFAKLDGYVSSVSVDIGDKISASQDGKPGTVLCELEVPELREELEQKVATVTRVEAEIKQADAAVKLAQASLASAEARVHGAEATVAREESRYVRWQSEYERVSKLAESGVVTRKVADETLAERDAAAAGRQEVAANIASVQALRDEARAGAEKAEADAVAQRAHLAVAVADRRRIESLLEYTKLRAPYDGIVVARNVHTGHLVSAGGKGGAPLLTVMRIDPLRILVDVPETDAVHVAQGTKCEVRIPSLPGATQPAAISRTSWSLDNTSRTLSAEIDLPNAEGKWRPGLYVQVKITVAERPDAIAIPKTAIFTVDKQTSCYVVQDDGIVKRAPIELGLQAGTDFEVRSGLTGDEFIIAANAGAFREGQRVELFEAPPAAK